MKKHSSKTTTGGIFQTLRWHRIMIIYIRSLYRWDVWQCDYVNHRRILKVKIKTEPSLIVNITFNIKTSISKKTNLRKVLNDSREKVYAS